MPEKSAELLRDENLWTISRNMTPELESLRKRSLEREQIVRRELQDEINRNRLKKE